LTEIDLHGLFVEEALERVEQRIRLCRSRSIDHLIVIVGRGNHSANGISRLKPAVTKLITEHQLRCTPNRPNSGCLYIEFVSAGEVSTGDSWLSVLFGNNCIIL
jgi:hypothetical protein